MEKRGSADKSRLAFFCKTKKGVPRAVFWTLAVMTLLVVMIIIVFNVVRNALERGLS